MRSGEERRDAGAALVLDLEAVQRWKGWAIECIEILAESDRVFSAEDVRAVVGSPPDGHENVMGAVFLAMSRRGVIEGTGYIIASRPSLHSHPITMWRGSKRD